MYFILGAGAIFPAVLEGVLEGILKEETNSQ